MGREDSRDPSNPVTLIQPTKSTTFWAGLAGEHELRLAAHIFNLPRPAELLAIIHRVVCSF